MTPWSGQHLAGGLQPTGYSGGDSDDVSEGGGSGGGGCGGVGDSGGSNQQG